MMQAQAIRTEVQAISATQSLAVVQTLLKAGLGCITFLRRVALGGILPGPHNSINRNLLPDENFAEGRSEAL